MATKAEKLADLQTELAAIKTAITAARTGASSITVDGMTVSNWNLKTLQQDRARVEKSIQRLLAGGRGIVIDMSAGDPSDSVDPYRSGSEVLL